MPCKVCDVISECSSAVDFPLQCSRGLQGILNKRNLSDGCQKCMVNFHISLHIPENFHKWTCTIRNRYPNRRFCLMSSENSLCLRPRCVCVATMRERVCNAAVAHLSYKTCCWSRDMLRNKQRGMRYSTLRRGYIHLFIAKLGKESLLVVSPRLPHFSETAILKTNRFQR